MKKIGTILLFLSFYFSVSYSQSESERVSVKTGDTLNYVLDMGFQYLYPEFTRGNIYFKTREVSSAFMNYNILLNEIHFVDQNSAAKLQARSEREFLMHAQSVVLDDVLFVSIGRDIFFNTSKGVMFLVANYDIKLLQRNIITLSSESKIGAYGQRTQTSSIEPIRSIPERFSSHAQLTPQVIREYSRVTEYYLYKDGRLFPANQRRFERLFPQIRNQIREFIILNKTDFTNPKDVEELLRFCSEKSD